MNKLLQSFLAGCIFIATLWADQGMMETVVLDSNITFTNIYSSRLYYSQEELYFSFYDNDANTRKLQKYDANLSTLVADVNLTNPIVAITSDETYLYTSYETGNMAVIKKEDLSNVLDISTDKEYTALAVYGDYIFALNGASLDVYELTASKDAAEKINSLSLVNAKAMAIHKTTLYVVDGYDGIKIIDAANPKALVLNSKLDGTFDDIKIDGSTLYGFGLLDATLHGFKMYDVSSPLAPRFVGQNKLNNYTQSRYWDVQSQYLCSMNSSAEIYDVSNKLTAKAVTNTLSNLNLTSNVVMGKESIYFLNGQILQRYLAVSDFANTKEEAKTLTLIALQDGIIGSLDYSLNDKDYHKVEIPSGPFVAYLRASDDINCTIQDESGKTLYSAVGNNLEIIQENMAAGTYSFLIENNSTDDLEYKLEVKNETDDYANNKNDAKLIPINSTIEGSISNFLDYDFFKISMASAGELQVALSTNIKVKLYDEYDNEYSFSKEDNTYTFNVSKSGECYLGLYTTDQQLNNKFYTFDLAFTKNSSKTFVDNVRDVKFKKLVGSATDDYTHNFYAIASDTKSLFLADSAANTHKILKYSKENLSSVEASYISNYGEIRGLKAQGNYLYVRLPDSLIILNKNLNEVKKIDLPNSDTNQYKKVIVNGKDNYINIGSKIYQLQGDAELLSYDETNSIDLNTTVNDFAFKVYYNKEQKQVEEYLYATTDNGLYVYKIDTDFKNSTLIQKLQEYNGSENYNQIEIQGDYAYVGKSGNYKLGIYYIKRPTSTPKLKSSLENLSMEYFEVAGDFVYTLNREQYLRILNVADATAPQMVLLEDEFFKARTLNLNNGMVYFAREDTAVANQNHYVNYIASYDGTKDYADTKTKAYHVAFGNTIRGNLLNNDDKDIFYFELQSAYDFNITTPTNGLTFSCYNYADDTLVFSQAVDETLVKTLEEGAYYLVLEANNAQTLNYLFKTTLLRDDYANNYSDAKLWSSGTAMSGLIDTDLDKDLVFVELEKRTKVSIKNTKESNVTIAVYYDDGKSKIKTATDALTLTLNPGKYYIEVGKKETLTSYNLTIDKTAADELVLPDGLKKQESIFTRFIAYGPRYIYAIDDNNRLLSYNHLLQRLDYAPIEQTIYGTCGKVIYNEDAVYVNLLQPANNECSGYMKIQVDIKDNKSDFQIFGGTRYFDELQKEVKELKLLDIKGSSLFEFSNGGVYKIDKSQQPDESNTLRAVWNTTASFTNLKGVELDGNKLMVAIDDTINFLDTTDFKYFDVFDKDGNKVGTDHNVTLNPPYKTYRADGDIVKMFIYENKLYFMSKNSTEVKSIDYQSNDDLSTKIVANLGFIPNNFYIKESAIYISGEQYGVKIYNLGSWELLKDVPNIGKKIDNPYTSDGTTLNYTSLGELKVFFLGDSFSDDSSSNIYTVSGDEGVHEGCFIATAAYGSYFQQHVKVLRDFRDNVLLKTDLGREFVHLYYTYSPDIAAKIAQNDEAKWFVRVVLTPVVYAIEYPLALLGLIVMFFLLFVVKKQLIVRKKVALS